MIFAIDFDGTIVENKWPDIGEPKQRVVDYIRQLQNIGHKWILWTCRSEEELPAVLKWCEEHGLYPDYVNDNATESVERWKTNPRKVSADVYIDDHNAGGVYLPNLSCYGRDFTWALRKMMDGKNVTRRRWTLQYPEQFIYMASGTVGENPHFRCHTGIGSMIATWLPMSEDLLADDWYAVDPD